MTHIQTCKTKLNKKTNNFSTRLCLKFSLPNFPTPAKNFETRPRATLRRGGAYLLVDLLGDVLVVHVHVGVRGGEGTGGWG